MAYNSMVGRIRILKSTIWAMVIVLSSSGIVFGKERGFRFNRFLLDYGVVEHFKNDQGYLKELIEIYNKAPDQADSIARYWRIKAAKENSEQIERIINLWIAEIAKKPTDEERYKFMSDKIAPIIQAYYYDHWDEINKMIIEKYQHLFPDKPIKKLSKP